MKIVFIKQDTIRPVYANGKIFASFSYDVIDSDDNFIDKHEKHLPLKDSEMLPLNELMDVCYTTVEEYRVILQEQLNSGVN